MENFCVDNNYNINHFSEEALVKLGIESLNKAFIETVNLNKNKTALVPLSGGLDSRAILASLLKFKNKSEIIAVTFGIPGTWDFEIGKLVAQKAGVPSYSINLNEIRWKNEELIRFASLCSMPIPIFEGYLFHQIRNLFNKDCIYWSGFMGEALSGAHLPKEISSSWNNALLKFTKWNRNAKSYHLTKDNYIAKKDLPESPLIDILSYDDQLDFAIRQEYYIKPLVLLEGYRYATPFLNSHWIQFILSLPRKYRLNQYLYKKILLKAYPQLFSLPTKNTQGLSINSNKFQINTKKAKLRLNSLMSRLFPNISWPVSPGINYIDFNRGLRERNDLKSLVFDNIQDLKKRDIIDWLDFDLIWGRHQKKLANYADALLTLVSLEIFLKVND